MRFLSFGRIEAIVYRKPGIDRRHGLSGQFDLAERDPQGGADLSSKVDNANGVCAALTPSYTLRLMSKNFGSPKRASRF
jgi:hypothetical protein